MASAKLLLLLVSLLLFGGASAAAAAAAAAEPPPATQSPDDSLSPLKLEADHLRSKISSLEPGISDRVLELKSKDESVARLESIAQEKSAIIASLRAEIESIQKKGAVDGEELLGRAYARAGELEKQAEKLRNEIETQNMKREALEVRTSEAENQLQELNSKLETLLKTNDDQKQMIRKTERALKVAEEELMRAQLEATSKVKELTEIHGAWLPPWFATRVNYFQELAAAHWNKHVKPASDTFLQKVYEKSSQAQKWVKPHMETVKTKWIPTAKEQSAIFIRSMEPHIRTVSTKYNEFYVASQNAIAPHIAKVQESADPYFQEIKKFSKPYIDQVVLVTKPHVAKARFALKPYTKRLVRAYRKFRKSASAYHLQVQKTVMKTLRKYELTKSLATKELVWFMASALLAFPVLFLYRLLAAVFCKKARKPTRNAHASHASRRHKRRHADK